MADTYIAPNTTSAQMVPKIFSAQLFKKSIGDSFFIGKFASNEFIRTGDGTLIGTDPSKPIQLFRDLEKVAGDTIQYDLVADLRGDGVYGDDILKGKEKALSFVTDQFHIDQVRQGVDAGGRMTQKRTKHDLRVVARNALTRWFARYYDEALVSYLAGTRGEATAQWVLPTSWSGFANNSFLSADSAHRITYNSSGALSHTMTDADTMTLGWFNKIENYISTMDYPLNPVYVDNEPCYIVILGPKAVQQLKEDTSAAGWLEIQKAAGVRGANNPLFKDAIGKYGRFIIHGYSKIPYTTSGAHTYEYNLILGAQAAVMGFGNAGGQFGFSWHEELEDRGNRLIVDAGTILGIKKCEFDSEAFGCITLWTQRS